MTQTQLFFALLLTVLMCINAVREIRNRNFAMGVLLISIPVCGWVSIWVTS